MFVQAFNSLDNILRREAGCATEIDYVEQTSWLLFLKYLEGLEEDLADDAGLIGREYQPLLDEDYRWSSWAAPKDLAGQYDPQAAYTGDDLIEFVNDDLFPYLRGFRARATDPNTVEYKIGVIFAETTNKFQSGFNLRDALEQIDQLGFRTQQEKAQLNNLYEDKIQRMGNAGRNGGEYYTPRPLIRALVKVVDPKIGETVYDAACGSAGFLCEAYDHLRAGTLTTEQLQKLQTQTLYGQEKKSLAYVIGMMNMILHGIEAPNLIHTNSLEKNLFDVQDKDRYDIILANPPFGGRERKEIRQNFEVQTGETAFLFLQHFITHLKAGGRAAVVIKNTFLSNADNASRSLRQELLQRCNLHTILDCPQGTFLGAGVKTVVLFFNKGTTTNKIWYYQLDPGRSLGKTNPLNDDDMKEFVELQKTYADSEQSWSIDVSEVDQESWDLSVKNPNEPEADPIRTPQEILDEITALDAESATVLASIREML